MRKFLIFSLFFLVSNPVLAGEPVELLNRVTCTLHSESREIEIVANDAGHGVNYIIAGKTQEIGSCRSNKKKCREIFERLKAKLVRSGFKCET
jgi:hypothetical protein